MNGILMLWFCCVLLVNAIRNPKSVSIAVRNLWHGEVMVYWLPPDGGEPVPQTPKPTRPGTSTGINSYEGHSFMVAPAAQKKKDSSPHCTFWASVGECKKNPDYMLTHCQRACGDSARFVVGEAEELITIERNWTVTRTGPAQRAIAAMRHYWELCSCSISEKECINPAVCAMNMAESFQFDPKRKELELEKRLFEVSFEMVIEPKSIEGENPENLSELWNLYNATLEIPPPCSTLEECSKIAAQQAITNQKALAALRRAIKNRGEAKRNISCAQLDAETSFLPEAIITESNTFDFEGRPGRDLFFRPDFLPEARISLIENFISVDECKALVENARPRLRPATHAKDGDLHVVSKSRDAQQATVSHRGLPEAANVKERTVRLANQLSNYTLGFDGQEELMVIQYNTGQQYLLHCDGDCSGTPHQPGGRLATVLLYCQTADKGGATSFPNAHVHVKPQLGAAAYFHFRGPQPYSLTENWHTEHSGCPVHQGEKFVITMWLRDGVSKENPSHRFSPFGGPL
uniref:Procollagen-proline 4-dioxygenase n=1 Tax=Aureoumbra lagunensis TaxID=44058 RepID=A0A7S3K402_9STRA